MNLPDQIVLIAALSSNHVIGLDNRLPWKLATDWAYFKQVTAGYPMIMGRTSAESEDALFSDTHNVILSSRSSIEVTFDHQIADSFDSAFQLLASHPRVLVIGGENVFRQALPFADEMILTHIQAEFEGDSFFPVFEKANWERKVLLTQKADEENSHPFDIVSWTRKEKRR